MCQVGVVLYRRKHSQDTELTKLRSVLSVVCRSFFSSIVSIVAIKSEKSPHSYTSPLYLMLLTIL